LFCSTRLVRFSGCISVPSVMYWKKPMMATSVINMPYSRKLCFRWSSGDLPWWGTASAGATAVAGAVGGGVIWLISTGFHDRSHDLFLGGFGRGHFGHETAFVHHVDAVRDAEQLGHLRRDHDHALALGRHLGDEGVDLVLGAHVDAARGLVEDEQDRKSTRL